MIARPGFTLVEFLIVVGIMTLLAGMTAMMSASTIRYASFDLARETVRNELLAAQADALSGTADSSWGVAFSVHTVTRYKGSSYATRDMAFDRTTVFGDDIVLNGTSDVVFHRPMDTTSSTATIGITSGVLHATTSVNAVGSISIH